MRNDAYNTGFNGESPCVQGYGGIEMLSCPGDHDEHDKPAADAGKTASDGRRPRTNTTGSGGGSPVSVIVWTVALIILWAIFTHH
jgi:hypothetical protein